MEKGDAETAAEIGNYIRKTAFKARAAERIVQMLHADFTTYNVAKVLSEIDRMLGYISAFQMGENLQVRNTPITDELEERLRSMRHPEFAEKDHGYRFASMVNHARRLERERNLLAKLLSEAWDKGFLKTKITYDETELEERIHDALQHLTAGMPE